MGIENKSEVNYSFMFIEFVVVQFTKCGTMSIISTTLVIIVILIFLMVKNRLYLVYKYNQGVVNIK